MIAKAKDEHPVGKAVEAVPPAEPSSSDDKSSIPRQALTELARLQAREQLFDLLMASLNVVLWVFDWRAQRLIYVSPAYERIFGRPAAAVLESFAEWQQSIHPDDREQALAGLAEVLEKGAIEQREYRIVRGDGQLRWLSDKCFCNEVDGQGRSIVVGIAEDITEKKRFESELQMLATTDALTQSSNRRHFFECAQSQFHLARQGGFPLAFLLLDVDDFKRINDNHGHQVGDQVLCQLARCGASLLRRGDLFGRIGGEEFAALFPYCRPEEALQIAERLQRSIRRLVFNAEDRPFRITVSQGLVSLRPDDTSLSALYARADEAMYQAKRQGKDRIVQA